MSTYEVNIGGNQVVVVPMSVMIAHNDKRGGFYFISKEHGDCLYSPTLDGAKKEARFSWGEDIEIVVGPDALYADFQQRMQVAS